MGLAERRGVKAYQDSVYPTWKAAMDSAAGFEVPIEVEWSSLGADGYAHMYEEAFTKVYFEPLVAALQDICRDELGRDALREGLKKLVIRNEGGLYGGSAFSFENGIFTINHEPITNISDVDERRQYIVKMLEAGL